MKKVVAMVLSLVMALGLMAGCGQKDAGKASGGTKTIESLKIAFSPVCGRRSDHDGDRTARGAAQGEAAGKGL